MPPEKPRKLAKMIKGRPSLLASSMAVAVLRELSGNQTVPARETRLSVELSFAGSAGSTRSMLLVSAAMTATGIPLTRPRPVTIVCAHPPVRHQPWPCDHGTQILTHRFEKAISIEDTRLPGLDAIDIFVASAQKLSGVVWSLRRLIFDISVPGVASWKDGDSPTTPI